MLFQNVWTTFMKTIAILYVLTATKHFLGVHKEMDVVYMVVKVITWNFPECIGMNINCIIYKKKKRNIHITLCSKV